MTAAGCQWGSQLGPRGAALFRAGKGFEETPTLKRSNAHEIVGEECRACARAWAFSISPGFSRFEVSGPNAEAWLDGLMASTLPKPGRARLAPMLGHDGRLKGDLTVFNWGDGTWWIMGSYYLRAWHMRWFNDHMRTASPCATWARTWRLLPVRPEIARGDREADRGCRRRAALHGLRRVRHRPDALQGGRMSVSGELGYEIHCRMGDHIALREALLEAGADLGSANTGSTRSCRCGWRKASASGRRSSPKATRRA
jgi:dimethylglycine dehydrogenase